MVLAMKETGRMIKCMVKEYFITNKEKWPIKEHFLRTDFMALVTYLVLKFVRS